MGKKKMGKQARIKKRQEHAETFNEGFTMGYNMGYDQAIKDIEHQAKRNILKFAHYNR
jgi:hypothetical protein